MLYNLFNFQSNDNWDTDGLYWYNELYTKKPVWTGLNQFHGLQKTSPRWSGLVPAISGSVLDQLRSIVAHFGGKKPDWTRLVNIMNVNDTQMNVNDTQMNVNDTRMNVNDTWMDNNMACQRIGHVVTVHMNPGEQCDSPPLSLLTWEAGTMLPLVTWQPITDEQWWLHRWMTTTMICSWTTTDGGCWQWPGASMDVPCHPDSDDACRCHCQHQFRWGLGIRI